MTNDSPESTVAATVAVDPEADQAAADAALLLLSDFEPGWSEVPRSDDETAARVGRDIAECAGSDEDEVMDFGGAKAKSGDFTSPGGDSVNNSVAVAPSLDAAAERMAVFESADFATCIHDVYEDAMKSAFDDIGATLDELTVAKLNVTPVGDKTVALRVTVSGTKDGVSEDLYTDTVLVQSGRMVTSVNFQSSFTPFDIDETERIVGLVASRMTAL